MSNYKIISSGSQGNCIIYRNIMVDCGVSFKSVEKYINNINIILLTHQHGDHLKLSTIKRIQLVHPSIRIACGTFLVDKLEGVRNIDVINVGVLYNYGAFKIAAVKLYHDVQNFGWRILFDDYKIFHATDTQHLEGITAKNYNLYAIEANYDEEKAQIALDTARANGEFCRVEGSINSHLSYQQSFDFFIKNKGDNSEIIRLHKSKQFY